MSANYNRAPNSRLSKMVRNEVNLFDQQHDDDFTEHDNVVFIDRNAEYFKDSASWVSLIRQTDSSLREVNDDFTAVAISLNSELTFMV